MLLVAADGTIIGAIMIKLLHVDDDEVILEIAKMALEISDDIKVVQCISGQDALRKVNEFIPDVFLLDVMMPGMTGQQTLEKLRERPSLKNVPVIFMTARASATNQDLFNLGAIDVIDKPFDPMALSVRIKSALNNLS